MELSPQNKLGNNWFIGKDERDRFLRPVAFSEDDFHHIRACKDGSAGHQCLALLRNISESLQRNNVLVSDRISVDQTIWTLKIYKDDPSSFPITNVPIKCNVMATMVDSLREYVNEGMSESSLSGLLKTLDYLRKLLEAVIFKAENPALAQSSPDSLQTKTSGSLSSRGSIRRKPATAVSAGVPKSKPLGIDNLVKFHEYKPLIISLHHRLTFLDQSNHQNDVIFDFISQNVCRFILDDCKLLLADYIERRILQI